MARLPSRSFFSIGLIAGMSFSCAANAQDMLAASRNVHDGVYAVDITTARGGCDKTYRWTIVVVEGRANSPADGMMQATGKIDDRGVVSLIFRGNAHVATASGQMRDKTASGAWSSPTLKCAGSWSATRESGSPSRSATLAVLTH